MFGMKKIFFRLKTIKQVMLTTFRTTQSATVSSISLNSLCPLDSSHEKSNQPKTKAVIQINSTKSGGHVMRTMSVCHVASAGNSHTVTSDPVKYNFDLSRQLLFSLCYHCSSISDTCSMVFLAEFRIECDARMQLKHLF